ncbi:MAG: dihydrofolate reductase family protein [Anaerolineae bacterium]|nr:dihydrofolate reductase family protein [Anaerolineae bacterium]
MGKIIVSEFMSLDGVIEAPETWHFPYLSDEMGAYSAAQINGSDAFLMGRVTYDNFAGFWPTQTHNEFGFADKLNNAPKFVVSTTLLKADWNHTTLINRNVVESITRLKQQVSGNIGITGSATLIQTLMQADLVDQYQLLIHPIVVGKGKRLFQEGIATLPLKLVETRTFPNGVVLLVHQPAREA